MLHYCCNAELLKTETEVMYNKPTGPKTADYKCSLFGRKLGVSVTRAMKFKKQKKNKKDEYDIKDATRLLERKLKGILEATQNTDEFEKQLLHIWATSRDVADTVQKAYDKIPADLKSNTVVLVTVTEQTNKHCSMFDCPKR
ncbi:AAC-rich mRNA clone AAC4 protein-like [Antedon mediterranea]|uniref:AAC-rich mRNA clone AAC4 protein-like n=1 Tax=Antedon mediterranea TaxID=105859 RepID=UPI003AF54DFC